MDSRSTFLFNTFLFPKIPSVKRKLSSALTLQWRREAMKALKFYANEALRWCVKWLLISITKCSFNQYGLRIEARTLFVLTKGTVRGVGFKDAHLKNFWGHFIVERFTEVLINCQRNRLTYVIASSMTFRIQASWHWSKTARKIHRGKSFCNGPAYSGESATSWFVAAPLIAVSLPHHRL